MLELKKKINITSLTRKHHVTTTTIFLFSSFVLLQLEAVTIISNFTLLASENSTTNNDDVALDGSGNRKKHHVINFDHERTFKSMMSDYLHANSHFDDKQFEHQFRIMPSIFEYIFQCLRRTISIGMTEKTVQNGQKSSQK